MFETLAHLSFLGWVGLMAISTPGVVGLWCLWKVFSSEDEPTNNPYAAMFVGAVSLVWLLIGIVLVLVSIVLYLIVF